MMPISFMPPRSLPADRAGYAARSFRRGARQGRDESDLGDLEQRVKTHADRLLHDGPQIIRRRLPPRPQDGIDDEARGAAARGRGRDGGGLQNAFRLVQDLLDLDATDLDAAEVHGVITAAEHPGTAAGQRLQFVPVVPPRVLRVRGRGVAEIERIVVAAQQAGGEADRRAAQKDFAGAVRAAIRAESRKLDAQGGRRERRRRARLCDGPGVVRPADLRAAAVFDHRLVARQEHQVEHVRGVGAFPGGAERPDRAPIPGLHAAGDAPRPHQTRHQAQHRDVGVLNELPEAAVRRRVAVEGNRRAVDQRREHQPRPHHPSQARRPAEDVAGVNIVMEVRVGGALDRGRVVPGNRLRLAGRPRGEEDVDGILRAARDRVEMPLIGEERLPPPVLRPVRPCLFLSSGRQEDRSRRFGGHDLVVQGECLSRAGHRILGEHKRRRGDA